jgi:hypothetical protein
MTRLTELCYSHTDLEPLGTDITWVKKMDVLVLNKSGRGEHVRNAAQTAEIELDHHLLPLLHIAFRARIAGTLAVEIAARDVRMMAPFHST